MQASGGPYPPGSGAQDRDVVRRPAAVARRANRFTSPGIRVFREVGLRRGFLKEPPTRVADQPHSPVTLRP